MRPQPRVRGSAVRQARWRRAELIRDAVYVVARRETRRTTRGTFAPGSTSFCACGETADEQRTPGGFQRRGHRHSDHHHGARAEGAPRRCRLAGAPPALARVPELRAELRVPG